MATIISCDPLHFIPEKNLDSLFSADLNALFSDNSESKMIGDMPGTVALAGAWFFCPTFGKVDGDEAKNRSRAEPGEPGKKQDQISLLQLLVKVRPGNRMYF
jgi:hypothetical protein